MLRIQNSVRLHGRCIGICECRKCKEHKSDRRWYDSREGIGRVDSGTETETTSGTGYLQDAGKGREQDAEALLSQDSEAWR